VNQDPSDHFRRPPAHMRPAVALKRAERVLNQWDQGLELKIARYREHCFQRMIMGLDIVQQILAAQPLDRGDFAQNGPTKRVPMKRLAGVQFLEEIFGVILDRPDFFQHDLLFLFHVPRIESGAMKQVGEQGERRLQVLVQHLDVQGRGLTRGKGIQFPTKGINLARDLGDMCSIK